MQCVVSLSAVGWRACFTFCKCMSALKISEVGRLVFYVLASSDIGHGQVCCLAKEVGRC
jgi:hypothetical protein